MSFPVIKWSKCYYEDLGTQDEQGYYDYAYCYFIYEFTEALGDKIEVRQYTDEPGMCSLYVYANGAKYPNEEAVSTKAQLVAAVVGFLQETEEITEFKYFGVDSGYKSLNTKDLENGRHKFCFLQTLSEK